MNTNIDYLRELRTDLEHLAATHPDPRPTQAPATGAGRVGWTMRRWSVALVLACVVAIVPVAALAGVSPVGWLMGVRGQRADRA